MVSIPKYAKVIDYIQQYIYDNQLKNDDKLPTEKEISQELGYSRITVQRALKELQEKNVIYRVQGCGSYVGTPREEAGQAESTIIPLVMSRDSGVTRFFEILQGIERCFDEQSYYLSVHVTNDDEQEEHDILNKLVDKNFKYLMIAPVRSDRNVEFYFELIHRGITLVFIDILPNGLCGNLVTSDNVRGGYLAADHLLNQGYRNIRLISTYTTMETSILDRINGCRMALRAAGYPADDEFIRYYRFDEDVADVVRRVMRETPRPDAIFAINDVTAVHIYNTLMREGFRVPEDIAVIGFDNLDMTASPDISISSINQEFFQIGYQAADLCISLMRQANAPIQRRYLPVSLVARRSTARADGRNGHG